MLECRANISGFALGGVLLLLWRYSVVRVQGLSAVLQSRCVPRSMLASGESHGAGQMLLMGCFAAHFF